MNKSKNQIVKTIFLISQIGFTMLVTIFISMGIGYFVDKKFDTKLMVWFIVLGVVAGFRSVYILIRDFTSKDSVDPKENPYNYETYISKIRDENDTKK